VSTRCLSSSRIWLLMKETETSSRSALLATGVNLINEAATAEIVEALRRASIRTIVLKGPSLRRWLYEPEVPRVSEDIDLLVRSSDFPATESVLPRLGYAYLGVDAVGPGRPHCRIWQGRDNELIIELHEGIAGIGAPPEDAWSVLAAQTEEMLLAETPVEVLAPPARALHVALHAAQHGAEYDRTLTDLRRALEILPGEIWEQAAQLARRLQATQAFAAGLALLPSGRAAVSRLGLEADPSVRVALRAGTAPPMAEGLEWLTTVPGLRAKAAFLVRTLVPPPGYMRVLRPRTRRSRLRLALAYAWRPFWLLWHAGPALLAWRRARKTSGPR
jgi:Uncharacterised nucleotidyltransferase